MNTADDSPVSSTPESTIAPLRDPAAGASSVPARQTIYRKRSKRRNLAILLIVVAVAAGGVFLWRYLSSYESTDDAQGDLHIYPVSARISGYVVKVNVDDNQWVHQGDVLVGIDPRDYQVGVAQAQANLASAEATARSLNVNVPVTDVNTMSQLESTSSGIQDTTAGVTAAEKQLSAAHNQFEEAQANDVRAQDDLKRYKLLVDKHEVSQQIYDKALATARSSTASAAAATANESAAEQFVTQARYQAALRPDRE
jgi:membrane fusion protein (multidrug efflux system)